MYDFLLVYVNAAFYLIKCGLYGNTTPVPLCNKDSFSQHLTLSHTVAATAQYDLCVNVF